MNFDKKQLRNTLIKKGIIKKKAKEPYLCVLTSDC